MQRNHLKKLLFTLIGVFFILNNANAQTLYMTEIPGETEEANGGSGITLEIIRAMFEKAGLPLEEKFYPWTRSVKLAARNGFIAPFSRNEERENNYIWIEPIVELKFVFVSLDKPYSSKTDAMGANKIGIWRSTAMEKELVSEGFKNLYPVDDAETLKNLLMKGRIQAWYGSIAEARAILSGLPEERRKRVRFGDVIKTQPVWLASGKSIPLSNIGKLKEAFKSLTSEGKIKQIITSRDKLFE